MTRQRENWRKATVELCLLFFILILIEGVMRKWLLNPIQAPLVLLRDPILFLIYVQYCFYKNWKLSRILTTLGFLVLYMFLLTIFFETSYLEFGANVYLIGLRNYLFFVPLIFVIPNVFTREDVNRFIVLFLYLTIPSGLAAVLQFYSPVDSFINKGIDDNPEFVFQVVTGVVRPYGLFTFSQAQATYAALSLTMALIALERRSELKMNTPLFAASLVAIGSMGVLSGSRTYFLAAGMIFISYAIASVTSSRPIVAAQRGLIVIGAVTALSVLMIFVFPQALETMTERQVNAERDEGSTLIRAVSMATEVATVFDDTPFFGRGIGFGTNAGAYLATGSLDFNLAEYEFTRIVQECGPFLGLIVISMRVALAIWLGILAIRANLRNGDAAPLLIFGYIAPLLFIGQISGQNTLVSLAWFTVGIAFALEKTKMTSQNIVLKPTKLMTRNVSSS